MFLEVPSDELDKFISETSVYIASTAALSENEDFKKGSDMLNKFFDGKIENAGGLIENTRLERAKDFTHLFAIGIGGVPLYESIYRSPEKVMKQDPWSKVKAFYLNNKFKVLNNVCEDHISIEMMFLGLLSNKIADNIDSENWDEVETLLNLQRDFYGEHLLNWAYDFCDAIIAKSDNLLTPFYPAFAYMLKGFISEDVSYLDELLEG
jgi:TorA maturation chaperone TorD